ncbi:uncharacterized protein LOC129900268 [Solanum dulcamara]|uniref:uncharacterized protein LOC129900268 n=1 Tax=Solanum dulcamara TaxID=45834 RepID=UPI002486A8C5|nr:uncharacterized protein LOC129900268 [Solanum dulcamara]
MQPGAKWEEVKSIKINSAELWKWNSSIPYLYCAVGFICAAIAFAIFYRFQNRENSISVPDPEPIVLQVDEEKKIYDDQMIRALDAEPKIVLVFVDCIDLEAQRKGKAQVSE